MTPMELRYEIHKLLSGLPGSARLVSPVPGDFLEITFESPDPYGADSDATRNYRILIEEV